MIIRLRIREHGRLECIQYCIVQKGPKSRVVVDFDDCDEYLRQYCLQHAQRRDDSVKVKFILPRYNIFIQALASFKQYYDGSVNSSTYNIFLTTLNESFYHLFDDHEERKRIVVPMPMNPDKYDAADKRRHSFKLIHFRD